MPTSSTTARLSYNKTAVLVIQEAGYISLWSLLDGAMIWQSDLTTVDVAAVNSETLETTSKDATASLGMMHALSRQLPAAIGTPLTRSPAGSARASPRPPMTSVDASMRRSMLRAALSAPDASTNSRLRESHAAKLHGSVQTFAINSKPVALLWDSHSSSVLLVDLSDGRLLLHEPIYDVLATSIPKAAFPIDSQNHFELLWFSESQHKLQKQRIRILTPGAEDRQPQAHTTSQQEQPQGFVLDKLADDDSSTDDSWCLSGDDAQADKVHVSADRVIVLSPTRLSVLDTANGSTQLMHEATTGQFRSICGSSRDGQYLLIQTTSGLVRLDLATSLSGHVEQDHLGLDTNKARLSVLTSCWSSRLCLAWNLPGSGELLEKIFLLQAFASDKSVAAEDLQVASELATVNLTTSQMENLLASPGSESWLIKDGHDAESVEPDSITALLPLSLERIAVASSGSIRIVSLTSIAAGALGGFGVARHRGQSQASCVGNSLGADHEICLLRSAVAPRSGQRLIIGGTLQGEVGFWQANTSAPQDGIPISVPQLEAVLSVSTTPIEALVIFGDEDNTIRLHGCVACICADSSVTIVLLEGFQLLYTVPGRGARLTSLAVRVDDLLLTYDDDKARVWDLRSQELRRSIATDQAQALVEDGKGWWTVKNIEPYSPLHSGTTGVLSQLASARDGVAASLLVDFRRAIEAAARAIHGSGQPVAKEDFPQTAPRSGSTNNLSLHPSATLRSEPEVEQNQDETSVGLGSPAARKAVNIIRPLLPTVFPTGLDPDMDAKLAALLDLEDFGPSAFSVGLHSTPDALMVGESVGKNAAKIGVSVKQAWKLSSRLTTLRLVVACALLRVLSHVNELQSLAVDLQGFVENEARLSTLVGVGYRGVRLEELVPYWLDSNMELQNASRSMFQGALARLEQSELDELCSRWQGLMMSAKTSTQNSKALVDGKAASNTMQDAELRTRALALMGSIAVERYTSLSPRTLKDIAGTIHAAIVSDRGNEMRTPHELQTLAVAIELCRNGFSMWQHYFDATEVVRSLFALSTLTSSSSSSSTSADGDLRTLAREATLQIAAENTPLFMTTLSLDILHARSAAHCSATMRLVALMVRKRPGVLVANLPRLAEAVVKSLDPTHTTMREAVVHAATVIITELVSTYPNVSFFGGGQRLAVGTHEGAVIVYDLKTATRLYVLEGHRRRADAVSFSVDGKRLVTMSLDEGRVLVWKTASGFSSFFSPGQMPRQGATDTKLTDGAYKAFLFNVGDQQSRSEMERRRNQHQEQEFVGFDKIGFHWNSERSVRVQIGEAQLNISVD